MKTFKLNDGNTIPAVGFGTYKATEEAVQFALEAGYRLLDTASIYKTEGIVAKALKESSLKRNEYYVTTKVWRENLGYDNTKIALQKSLSELQLDYIDLYLIHWPANEKNFGNNWQKVNAETWKAMEELQSEGLIKSIGVSNFWEEHFEALFKTAHIIPAVNQIEFHPGYWQKNVTEYCKQKGIILEAWSPLGRAQVLENDYLKQLAEKYSKTVSQICLKWIMQRGIISIPKSSDKGRIKENISLEGFELSTEEINAINELPLMGFSGELPNFWPDRSPAMDR